MDLDKLNSRNIGLFSKRINIGRFLAEKTLNDFTKKGEAENQTDYEAYLDAEDQKAYVLVREIKTSEARALGGVAVADEIIARLPAEKQVEYYAKKSAEEVGRSEEVMKLVRECIVGHNFTNSNGTIPSIDEIRDMCFQSSNLISHITSEWMATSVNFQKAKDESSSK